jgi:SAM-dependent methyltransferase
MNAPAIINAHTPLAQDPDALRLRCPRCAGAVVPNAREAGRLLVREECHWCGHTTCVIEGIWRTLRPGRANYIEASLSGYESVREKEGRWSEEEDFYRSLPWRDTTGRFADQWKIRARSFAFVRDHLIPQVSKTIEPAHLKILDIGAGNCWMSYRLALQGHAPVAVDIGIGNKDGLGAARHYKSALGQLFPRFQAEMDWLPFADGQFDLAIYNASLHYAGDYGPVLREAVRVLRPSGAIVIIDSPTYRNEADGEAMKREKTAEFARKFGSDAGTIDGQLYLTPERLARLERLGIRWRRHSLWYGWRWAMRPIVARMQGRRRPSQFHIYFGTLSAGTKESE